MSDKALFLQANYLVSARKRQLLRSSRHENSRFGLAQRIAFTKVNSLVFMTSKALYLTFSYLTLALSSKKE